MKKTIFALLAVLLVVGSASAQGVTFSGEVSTGFYMDQEQINEDKKKIIAEGGMTNTDGDSGASFGRIRLNFSFGYENIGFKFRFQIEPITEGPFLPRWNYAFAFGNFFNEQLTVSAGVLGESPWATGGPRLRTELEAREYFEHNILNGEPLVAIGGLWGIRFEYKPSFIPGLNIGFVLNQPDQQVSINKTEQTFGDVLGESVVGVAYEHEYFAVILGYRFDSKADRYTYGMDEGSRFLYRMEERALKTVIPGMQLLLNGVYYGIGNEQQEIKKNVGGKETTLFLGSGEYFINWLHWLWDADAFIAKLDACYSTYQSYNNTYFIPNERQAYDSIDILPAFYVKFLNNLLQAGVGFGLGMEFGTGKTYKASEYQYYFIEPMVKVNLSSNAYLAAVYRYTDRYAPYWLGKYGVKGMTVEEGDKSVVHMLNIRAVFSF